MFQCFTKRPVDLVKMYAVYSLAHREASIVSDGPAVRLNGFLDHKTAETMSNTAHIETRIWPCSVGPKTPEQSATMHWRPITINSSKDTLEAEYASIDQRVTDWILWRESVSSEVLLAAHERRMRDVSEIRATKLLCDYASIGQNLESPKPYGVVPAVKRDDEVRGQTWAIVGICGDADYERSKHALLQSLGSKYIEKLQEATGLSDSNLDVLEASLTEPIDLHFVEPFASALRLLTPEPLVAFFEAGEDPEALAKRADLFASAPEMKHADIAVIRLYEWIRLDRVSRRATRSNRDTRAREFFETVRNATT